ncbi:hypothetical protein [Dyadobacter sp. NIV53]|uniref:hypothetical protein n=1 Tax=Dyadobacter sp. NIV53 TaxID=2861765 RepID=UPI001C86E435|nr:hypothetical protein [Dyadobacter sp. NIV53]
MLSFGFEYQADDYAIDRMVDTFYADVPEARPFGERFSAMTKMSPVSRFRLWITTIGSLFLLLEAVRLAKNRNLLAKVMASKQSHPFPSNRFYNLIHTSILFSEKNYHFDRTIFDAAVENSIKDLEIIAKFLNVEQPSINDELAMVRGKNTAMKVLMEIESDLIKYRQIVI